MGAQYHQRPKYSYIRKRYSGSPPTSPSPQTLNDEYPIMHENDRNVVTAEGGSLVPFAPHVENSQQALLPHFCSVGHTSVAHF